MARAALTVQNISRTTGLAPSLTAAATDGHAFNNSGKKIFLYVKTGGTAVTITIPTPGTVDGMAIPDKTISVGATADALIGPFPNEIYAQVDATLGISQAVYVDYSVTTNVQVAVIRLPKS